MVVFFPFSVLLPRITFLKRRVHVSQILYLVIYLCYLSIHFALCEDLFERLKEKGGGRWSLSTFFNFCSETQGVAQIRSSVLLCLLLKISVRMNGVLVEERGRLEQPADWMPWRKVISIRRIFLFFFFFADYYFKSQNRQGGWLKLALWEAM